MRGRRRAPSSWPKTQRFNGLRVVTGDTPMRAPLAIAALLLSMTAGLASPTGLVLIGGNGNGNGNIGNGNGNGNASSNNGNFNRGNCNGNGNVTDGNGNGRRGSGLGNGPLKSGK